MERTVYGSYRELEQQIRYPFRFTSYLEDEMTEDKKYYYDKDHLNYLGAYVFTQKLKQMLGEQF